MQTLYVSQQGCYLCLVQETLVIKQKQEILAQVQLPLLEQVLIFGKSQVTTQAIRACLQRNIPIAYLSRMGYCYGRLLPLARGYRHLTRYQQQLTERTRLIVAQRIVQAKLKNSRVLLQRQHRRRPSERLLLGIQALEYLSQKALEAETVEQLMGFEGAGANEYFTAYGECLTPPEFNFIARRRRPPTNPVNALLSFGYQVLWNHLLSLIELQGLDPYHACLHQGTERHAALASDLIEEFRAPIIDSLVLWLVNSKVMNAATDFEYRDGGCFLNNSGRRRYLKFWLQRMEESINTSSSQRQPRWDLLTQQVKQYRQFVYQPAQIYQPYQTR